ncbi:hypothetical protein SAMN05421690_100729 [Nitrosomonas sp. Nm51]|uniref:hypothetical protein n=1 Tax=Nitrosomonas sp. Nm51 TaxID=133720 RepID=UPI0008CFAEC8|nr:hypothetical protein [Nitrosomonas sp. Nm51]SER06368.1 hypothetical protein SAMN05421690_100729 [Nitrosomonas sp. Nm51]
MTKNRDERHRSGTDVDTPHSLENPLDISPEARELLQTANTPLEFRKEVQVTEWPVTAHAMEKEHWTIFPGTQETSIDSATLETPAEPEWQESDEFPHDAWPLPEADRMDETEWESPSGDVHVATSEISYLSDITLNMTGVAHMTSGLQNLAGIPIGGLVSASYSAFWLPPGNGMLYTDIDDYGRTVVRNKCEMTVFFQIEILKDGKVHLPRTRFSDFRPELKLFKGASLRMHISARSIKGLPGKLIIEWQRNGRPVKFVNIKKPGQQAQEKDQFEVTAKDKEDLEAKIKKIEKEGWVFLVPPPQPLPKHPATIQEMLVGTIKLIPDNDPQNPCEDSDRLSVIWSAAEKSGSFSHKGPRSFYAGSNLIQIAEKPRDYTREGTRYKIFDLELYWAVKNLLNCCKTSHPYAVIQFAWARALIKQQGKFRKQVLGHDWTLDILDSEKSLARNGNAYDPRFTNNPRNTRPQTKPDIRPGKTPGSKPAIVQQDSPGISFSHFFGERGDDNKFIPGLSGRGGCVIIDFIAFLVCDNPAFQQGNPAENYKRAKVEKRIQYRIVYSFKGNAQAPNVVPQIIRVKEIKCKTFGYYLKKSRVLRQAYSRPPESLLEEDEKYKKENEKVTFKGCFG